MDRELTSLIRGTAQELCEAMMHHATKTGSVAMGVAWVLGQARQKNPTRGDNTEGQAADRCNPVFCFSVIHCYAPA